jgi:tetratricopeptide (TPR) repeat protein
MDDAARLFERALTLDPQNVSAMIGRVATLTYRLNVNLSDDRAGDIARAEELADRALVLQPHSSMAHWVRGYLFQAKHQWGPAIAEAEAAIAEDPNNADAYAIAGFRKTFLGHTEDGFAGIDTALRLSPRDPMAPWWQEERCELHANLAQWEQAIDWCGKSAAASPRQWFPYMLLAAANAWAGRAKEAQDATAQLLKLYPGFTVQSFLAWHRSDNPTYNAQEQRVAEGLRKAGVPEGEKKTN